MASILAARMSFLTSTRISQALCLLHNPCTTSLSGLQVSVQPHVASASRLRCRAMSTIEGAIGAEQKQRIEPPDVADLCERARLSVSPEEMEDFKVSLGRIVDWFGQLQEIDVEGVPPAIRVGELEEGNTVRPDVAVTFEERAAMIAQAPEMEGPYLRVPKMLNENAE
eukprot:jgi/Mesen1/10428/ME000082S09930